MREKERILRVFNKTLYMDNVLRGEQRKWHQKDLLRKPNIEIYDSWYHDFFITTQNFITSDKHIGK